MCVCVCVCVYVCVCACMHARLVLCAGCCILTFVLLKSGPDHRYKCNSACPDQAELSLHYNWGDMQHVECALRQCLFLE